MSSGLSLSLVIVEILCVNESKFVYIVLSKCKLQDIPGKVSGLRVRLMSKGG